MFPLQYIHELLLDQEAPILVQDLTMDHNDFMENPKVAPKISKKRQRISKSDIEENPNEELNKEKHRKIMHRDIERQRRQEMSSLYTALRNLLPAEYVKGKRAVSDQMHEAVNYIKHMERNIKELRSRRDNPNNSSLSLSSSLNGSSNSANLPNCVTVNSCWEGVEFFINCGIKEGNNGFSLSSVIMELMLHTELNIVSCISARVNERILYKILCEVNSLAYINLYELQQRIANVINI